MDINELQRYSGKNHSVFLSYLGQYGNAMWTIKLEAHCDGIKLECDGSGATPEEAFLEASAKFDRATFSGLPEMNPQLTYDSDVEYEGNIGIVTPTSDEPFS